jgi:hypothetical protein
VAGSGTPAALASGGRPVRRGPHTRRGWGGVGRPRGGSASESECRISPGGPSESEESGAGWRGRGATRASATGGRRRGGSTSESECRMSPGGPSESEESGAGGTGRGATRVSATGGRRGARGASWGALAGAAPSESESGWWTSCGGSPREEEDESESLTNGGGSSESPVGEGACTLRCLWVRLCALFMHSGVAQWARQLPQGVKTGQSQTGHRPGVATGRGRKESWARWARRRAASSGGRRWAWAPLLRGVCPGWRASPEVSFITAAGCRLADGPLRTAGTQDIERVY